MQSLEAGGFSEDDVKKILLGSHEISFEYELLDKNDKYIGKIDCDCTMTHDSSSSIKRSAAFTIREKIAKDVDFLSDRIRPYIGIVLPDGKKARWSKGIFLLSTPDRIEQGGELIRRIEAYDKSLILMQDRFTRRYYLRAGSNVVEAVKTIVTDCGIRKLRVDDSALSLREAKEFEIGTSKLEAVNQLLEYINYNSMYFDENGYCCISRYISPQRRKYEFAYETDEHSVILPGASDRIDIYDIPNKFVRYVESGEEDYLIATYTNDKASNKLSTMSRGMTVTDVQSISGIADQETLNAYVERIADEKSRAYSTMQINTLLMPHHENLDCLLIRHDGFDVYDKYIEIGWEMEFNHKASMTHRLQKAVELW